MFNILKKNRNKLSKVFCIDQESYDYLEPYSDYIFKLDLEDDDVEKELINFRLGNWSKVVYKKFNIIYKQLLENDFVLFTDGDIVFKKPGFIEYCFENLKNHELIIQDDRLSNLEINNSKNHLIEELCTGFMLIRKNEKMLEIFNPDNIPELDVKCDQYYINSRRKEINYTKLPMELFPNGSYFRLHKENFMIHFNYIIGTRKKEK